MTLHIEEVHARVAHIREIAGDDEVAHSEEDKLRADVLRYVVENAPDWSSMHQLAEAALSTSEIEFARWCA